ncbi:hypothetical protein HDU86_007094 [Geranomyces michiganensis]|nr:hypothetical protein HDU86_007094 [Geranomyces michiganensis]
MLKALKVAAGLVPKVTLNVSVDTHNAKHPGSGVERGSSFLSVGPGTAAIRGTVTCLVHNARPLAVSEFKIVLITHVGKPQPEVKTDESPLYGRRLHEQEIVFWNDSRELAPGQHTFDFTLPFWGHMPNTTRSWRGLKGLDITHKLSAHCDFHWARGHQGHAQITRELVIYRHMDEEGKAFLDGKWLYHGVSQHGANLFCGQWKLRIVMQTHGALGDPIKVFFLAYVVNDHGRVVEANVDTLSCRLVECQEFISGTKSLRSLGPPTPFSPVGKRYITVDEADGRVISFDKKSSGSGGGGGSSGGNSEENSPRRAYYCATLATKQAQPRCTHELLSITHLVEFRVAPDFGGVLPGEAKLVLPVRLVYVPRRSTTTTEAATTTSMRQRAGRAAGVGSSSSRRGSPRLSPSASAVSLSSSGGGGRGAALCRPRCESLTVAATAFDSVSSAPPSSRRRRPDLLPTFIESVTIARGGSQQEWEAVDEYTPRMHDEIALQPGDLVTISPEDMFRDGWSRGTNVRTQESGVFPMANVVCAASRVDAGFAFTLTVPDEDDYSVGVGAAADDDDNSLHLYLGRRSNCNRSIRSGGGGGGGGGWGNETDDDDDGDVGVVVVDPPPNFGSLPPRYSASSTDLTALAAASVAASAASVCEPPPPPRYSRVGVPSPLGPNGGGGGGGASSSGGRHLSHRLSAPEMTHLAFA